YDTRSNSSVTIFFFSSRRRHTRSKRDWSSDVCSSDLQLSADTADDEAGTGTAPGREQHLSLPGGENLPFLLGSKVLRTDRIPAQIGRASCRERGEIAVGGVALRNRKDDLRVVWGHRSR